MCLKVTDFTCASVDAWENLYLSGSVKTCSYFKQEDQEHVLDKNGENMGWFLAGVGLIGALETS